MKISIKNNKFVDLINKKEEQSKKECIEIYLFMRKQKDKDGNRLYSDKWLKGKFNIDEN